MDQWLDWNGTPLLTVVYKGSIPFWSSILMRLDAASVATPLSRERAGSVTP
jgi:hypothetical protein